MAPIEKTALLYTPMTDRPRLPSSLRCLVLLLLIACSTASGAYVQQVPCSGIETPYRIGGLGARIDHEPVSSEANLYLDIYGLYQASDLSNSVLIGGSVVASVDLLSLSSRNSSEFVLPASPAKSTPPFQQFRLPLTINPRPFDEYLTEIRLRHAQNNTLFACSRAVVTPVLQRPLSAITQWLSPVALTLVLCTLLLSRTRAGRQSLQHGSLSADSGRVANCLDYVQFFFFLGALTLHFPGFMRPATSSSSWSTLMFPGGPVMGDFLYPGISDGIYEVNGTFGGTAELELVSQVTGAPVTMWTWINVISLACMLLASLIFIFQLGPKIPWTRRVFDSRTMQRIRGTETHGVRGTLYTVLRVFFSYFMTPVVAWTSYQLTYAPFLPVYHIIISVLVLVLIPAAFWWSLRQTTARQLGYFLVDAPFTQEDAADVPRAQDQFAFAIFVLMYLRGCAIGGLQVSGLLQLLMLCICEIVQLVVAFFLRRDTFLDTGVGLMCGLRLVLLLLCIGFLPGVAGHVQRSVLGVVVLCLHLAILAAVFIGPSVLRITMLVTRMMRGEPQEKQLCRQSSSGWHELMTLTSSYQVLRLSSMPAGDIALSGLPGSELSRVQRWVNTVDPADRVSVLSVNSTLSSCDTLVDRPSTLDVEAEDHLQVHAISLDHDDAALPSTPRALFTDQPPNFSRPLSMPLEANILARDVVDRNDADRRSVL